MNMKLSKAALGKAKKDGADVQPIRQVQPPPPKPEVEKPKAKKETPPELPNTDALEAEITRLRAEVAEMKTAAQASSQELAGILAKIAEGVPLRVKPIRDLDRSSETYLLVDHYDFVPVKYTRKLDS